jgi:hypothetical protein
MFIVSGQCNKMFPSDFFEQTNEKNVPKSNRNILTPSNLFEHKDNKIKINKIKISRDDVNINSDSSNKRVINTDEQDLEEERELMEIFNIIREDKNDNSGKFYFLF